MPVEQIISTHDAITPSYRYCITSTPAAAVPRQDNQGNGRPTRARAALRDTGPGGLLPSQSRAFDPQTRAALKASAAPETAVLAPLAAPWPSPPSPPGPESPPVVVLRFPAGPLEPVPPVSPELPEVTTVSVLP
jgi:hypothetical protein